MPIYEFFCKRCNKKFERFFRHSDEPQTVVCETCLNADEVEKVFSPPAFVFKGKGFYETDYKKPKSSDEV